MRRVIASLLLLAYAACSTHQKAERFATNVSGIEDSEVVIPLIEDLRLTQDEWLLVAIRSADAVTRARAALAMGRIRSPAYAAALTAAAAEDRDPTVAATALFSLGQLGLADEEVPEETLQTCITLLTDPEPAIATAAIEALGKLAPPGAAENLAPLLQHPLSLVRAEAALALFRTRWTSVRRGTPLAEVPKLPPQTQLLLRRVLTDPETNVRQAAAYALRWSPDPTAVAELIPLVSDNDATIRLFAIRALGHSAIPEIGERIVAALSDPSEHVRTEAVAALERLATPRLLPRSLEQDGSFHVRAAYARLLAKSEDPETIPILERLSEDPSPSVIHAALGSLALRKQGRYRELLLRAASDSRWAVRAAAARAAAPLNREGLAVLRLTLDDADRRVRTASVESLAGHEGVEPLLLEALRSEDLSLRGSAVSAWSNRQHPEKLGWLETTYDTSPGVEFIEVREEIASAIEKDPGSERLLHRMLEDPAPSVRRRAHEILRRKGVQASPPQLPPGTEPSPFLEIVFDQDPIVVMETTKGTMEIRCLPKEAPLHVASFVDLVRRHHYDGLCWHRVVSNFVIQGGDPRGDGWGGAGFVLRDEINRARFTRGSVGMPRAGFDTGGGQLFITHIPTPHLDGNYTLFGRVIYGLDVIDRIDVGDQIIRAWVKPVPTVQPEH